MTQEAIFELILKIASALPILIQAGIDVTTKIEQLISLSTAGASGTQISDADLAKIRAELDADLADFNQPMA